MSTACSQSRRKSASLHLNFELVSKNRYWLYSSVSVEVDKDTRCDKKWFNWMNENWCFI